MSDQVLRPCPFCGGEAAMMTFGQKGQAGTVACSACNAKISNVCVAVAVEAWNRRVEGCLSLNGTK